MSDHFQPGRAFAEGLDAADPIRRIRERFYVREDEIYLDGNSLGLCCKDAEAAVLHMLEVWKSHGIRMWNIEEGKYFRYPSYLGAQLAPLIGADANEVTVTGSTTVNIHQCLATFYQPTPERYKILVDELNFPTDIHAVHSWVKQRGYDPVDAVKAVPSRDGRLLDEAEIIAAMTGDVALILLPSVLYRSAQLLDMAQITAAARERGICIGWDLCHSIGAVPHDFRVVEPDFAVWCNYKYLSAGPGAIAGLFVNRRHFGREPGLAGWYGNVKETQFQLSHRHEPSPDVDGWLTGTPPMLAMAALEGVLAVYRDAGMPRVREKSLRLTAYLMYLIDQRLLPYGYGVGNPREDAARGGHVALEHPEAYRICQALKARGVIPDFREPNVIRLAPVALYNTYTEIYRLVEILETISVGREYEHFSEERALVV